MTFERKMLTTAQAELTERQKSFVQASLIYYEEQIQEQRLAGAFFIPLIHPADLIQLAAENKKDCFTFHNGRVFTTIGLTSYMQHHPTLDLIDSFFGLAEENLPLLLQQERSFYTQTFLAVLGFELLQPDSPGNKIVTQRNIASKIAHIMQKTFQYDSVLTPFSDQNERTLAQCLYEMHIRLLYQSLPARMDTFIAGGETVIGIVPTYGIDERILNEYYHQIRLQKKNLGVSDSFVILLGGGLYPTGIFDAFETDRHHWKEKIYQPLFHEAFAAGSGMRNI